ncbi:MAG: CoxG family protein [Dehalococcoidia bacterium]
MRIEGKFTLGAPIQQVWDFVLKPEVLGNCIPGTEKMDVNEDGSYQTVVKQKVGPISVKLNFTTALTETNPPYYIKAEGNGADMSKAGTFTQETIINLREVSENETEISYTSDISMVGRLATFGERIMRAKADKVGKEFTDNLQKMLKSHLSGQEGQK